METTEWKITNENLLDLVNELSESKLEAQTKIYNSVDTKASRIILFLWTIITILLQSDLKFIYLIVLIFFALSVSFSIAVIRPRGLSLWVNLSWLTTKYRNKNESKGVILNEIVGNINWSTDKNSQLIELKSKLLKKSLIMLCIWIGLIIIYYLCVYIAHLISNFYNLNLSICLKILN